MGIFGNSDKKQAQKWKKQAEAGDTLAEYNYGVCLQDGCGVPRNVKESVYWYQRAAEKGLREAQGSLGDIYYDVNDTEQAVYWWKKAAVQGDAEAKKSLASLGIRI